MSNIFILIFGTKNGRAIRFNSLFRCCLIFRSLNESDLRNSPQLFTVSPVTDCGKKPKTLVLGFGSKVFTDECPELCCAVRSFNLSKNFISLRKGK